MIRTSHASISPIGEAAESHRPTLDSAPPDNPSRGEKGPVENSRIRSLTEAAGDWMRALRGKLVAIVRDPIEFPESAYNVLRCRVCRLDVHRPGEMCERQWVGLCDVCGLTLLDYYRHCLIRRSTARTHTVFADSMRPATPKDWKRLRFTIVTGDQT